MKDFFTSEANAAKSNPFGHFMLPTSISEIKATISSEKISCSLALHSNLGSTMGATLMYLSESATGDSRYFPTLVWYF